MWWTTWPAHISGWAQRAEEASNVLFVRFEDMAQDLTAVARDVANFLEVKPLLESELADIKTKCSFAYMRDNADHFEMIPPHVLQGSGSLFVSGRPDRHREVSGDVRRRLSLWCTSQMAMSELPARFSYSDMPTTK